MSQTWERVTDCQLEMLLACESSKHGSSHCGSVRHLPSMWSLKAKGYIETSTGNWYVITERGKDFLRFGVSLKRRQRLAASPAEKAE